MTSLKQLIACIFILFVIAAKGQSHDLQLIVHTCPFKKISLYKVVGDKLSSGDTLKLENGKFNRIITGNSPGIYRLILGQTTYAKIMNAPPQQFDFIYNDEDIILETDFKQPKDSLQVIRSKENQVWYDFQRKEKKLKDELKLAEMELDYIRGNKTGFSNLQNNAAKNYITRYNQLQKQRDSLITKTIDENPELYVSKLVAMYREPFLDGNLSAEKRKETFHLEYFVQLKFSDESLMNSQVYTDAVFKYLMSYAQKGLPLKQQEHEFMNAVDIILANTRENEKVYEFIMDYLVRGFEKLQQETLVNYIAENYSGTTCQTDEYTTLERKLAALKMNPGTAVYDFSLDDINGDPLTLSLVTKTNNLLIFWASWCPHCNEMLPKIRNWQKQNQDIDLEIIAISLDTSEEEWKNKVFDLGIESWYNISDFQKWDGEVAKQYNIYATPTMFILNNSLQLESKPQNIKEVDLYFRNLQ